MADKRVRNNSIFSRMASEERERRDKREQERRAYKTMTRKEKKRYRREQRSAWLREDTTPVQLCKGARIPETVYQIGENRYLTLIIKGFIVYFLTAGGIGCYLTAMEIEFSQLIFNIVIFTTAILCAILYHSWRSENLGYLVFFVFYASVLILFKDYINSGFYAIINDTIEWASIYFDTEGLQQYNERITNRYAAVTIAVSLIGIAENIYLNNFILRRARYIVAIVTTVTLNIVAFYMEKEPSTIYTVMLVAGIVMTYVLKSGSHYQLSRNDHIFKRSKKGLSYGLDWKSLLHSMAVTAAFILIAVSILINVYDKTSYDILQKSSREKTASKEYVQNIIMLGIGGIFNFYDNTGGLATGKLGGVSSIQLDYNTDINIEFTPYSYDTLYIKNFAGGSYAPYENRWEQTEDLIFGDEHSHDEAAALKEAFEAESPFASHGVIRIKNVAGDVRPYIPYYTMDDTRMLTFGGEEILEYYPRIPGNDAGVEAYEVDPLYLSIPEQNYDVIKGFAEEAGFGGTQDEIINQVMDYYEENIPYTIRPGATPWREDFINYFLTENKKGYCAHFASAATLIFRYFGIPARYCEGYVVDYVQVIDTGEIVEDTEYSDYYQGYNALGETALISVDATDADAHAWVEVYDKSLGWTVVDVTPSSGQEEDYSSFWDTFNNIFGDGDSDSDVSGNYNAPDFDGFSFNENLMHIIAYIVLAAIILGILIYIVIRLYPTLKFHIDYGRAGLSDKTVMRYSSIIKKLGRKDEELRHRLNYHDQIEYLKASLSADAANDTAYDFDEMIDILERAGFSGREISDKDFERAESFMDALVKKNGKQRG